MEMVTYIIIVIVFVTDFSCSIYLLCTILISLFVFAVNVKVTFMFLSQLCYLSVQGLTHDKLPLKLKYLALFNDICFLYCLDISILVGYIACSLLFCPLALLKLLLFFLLLVNCLDVLWMT